MESQHLVLGLLIACIVVIPLGVAAADYSLSTDAEHDVPDRNVDFEGDTYTITHMSRVDEGDDLQVDVSGPSNTGYDVNLYNPDNQIADSEFVGGGDKSITFDMSFTPGSYALAVEEDNEIQIIQPVIIKAYDVSHSGPSSVTEGDSFDVTVEVTELSDEKDINYVEVVLANDVEDVTAKATKTNGDYEATISTDSLGTGDYSLYATVRGDKQVRNRDELLGFSDSTTVTIEAETPTPTPAPDDGGGGGGGSLGTPAGEGTPSEGGTPSGEGTPSGDDIENQPVQIEEEPDRETQAEIADSDSDSQGVTVEFESTESVQTVTFDDDSVQGSVEVAEYDEPPEPVQQSVADRYSGDANGDSSNGGPDVVQVVDVSPSSDSARQMSASVELSVPRSELANPDNAAILHEQSDGSWARLDTDVQATTDETVTLQADIDSFSLFAVVDESAVTPTPIQVSTPTPTSTPTGTATPPSGTATPTPTPTPNSVVTPQSPSPTSTDTPGASGPGFGIAGALVAAVLAVVVVRRSL